MNILTQRNIYLFIFLLCLGLLSFGLVLEHIKGLEPCPLCIFQRIAYVLVGIFALDGLIFSFVMNDKRIVHVIHHGLIILSAIGGLVIAGRQVWLQHLPEDQVPACGPGLEYMLDVFPLAEALPMIFAGSGECAEVQWTFLSFSIPEWSLVCFSLIIVLTVYSLIVNKRAE